MTVPPILNSEDVLSTRFPEIFGALAAPFDSGEVKVRSYSGRQMHYITARVAMNRLDDVVGPANWWDDYIPSENSVLCRLSIRLPDGSTLTKSDAGGYAGMSDQGDDDKSGYSDSFKRAAVKFGIARYLYRDGVPIFDREPATNPVAVNTEVNTARDERTLWQLVSDKSGEISDAYREATGNPDAENIMDARTTLGRILFLAWNEEKTSEPPHPDDSTENLAERGESLYETHRSWVRIELKKFFVYTLTEALRKASVIAEGGAG
jgi:hypothetical protein